MMTIVASSFICCEQYKRKITAEHDRKMP